MNTKTSFWTNLVVLVFNVAAISVWVFDISMDRRFLWIGLFFIGMSGLVSISCARKAYKFRPWVQQ